MTPVKLKIKDLGKVMTGKTPDTSKRRYYDGSYRFVTPSDIDYRNYYCRKTETTVTNEAEQKFRNQFIPKDSTMFVCIGNTIGKCALSDQKCMTNQQINSIIPSNIEHGKFIYYLMVNNVEIVRGVGIGGGAASPIINKTKFENLSISAPIKDKWIEIGQFLSLYDDLIETNLRRIHLLEETTRLLFREWFVYFRFPGHEKDKIIDGVPAGWEKTTLGKIASRIKKSYSINDEDLPLIDLARIQSRTLAVTEVGGSSDLETARIIFEKDDILFSSIRPYLHKVILAPFKGITNTSVFVVRSKKQNYRAYLTLLMFSDYAVQFANQHSTGTKMPVVKWGSISMIPAWIPPESIMNEFQNIIGPMLEQIQVSYFFNQKLAQARDLLLPRLMSGKIEV